MISTHNKLLSEIRGSEKKQLVKQNISSRDLDVKQDKQFNETLKRFISSFTTKLKTKSGDYIFERFDRHDTMSDQDFYSIQQKAKNILSFEFRGKRARVKEMKAEKNPQEKEFNNFARGLALLLAKICNILQGINLPYKMLRSVVHNIEELKKVTLAINDYLIAFPLKMCFVTDGDHYYYYFILPEFDLFILDVPIELPNLYVPDFTTNTCWNLFARLVQDQSLFHFEQDRIQQLINRCTLPIVGFDDALIAPKKNCKIVEYICIKVSGLIKYSERTIFCFFMRILVKKRIKERFTKKMLMKSKFKYWATTFVNHIKKMTQKKNECAKKIQSFFQRVLYKKKLLEGLRKYLQHHKNSLKLANAINNLIQKRANSRASRAIFEQKLKLEEMEISLRKKEKAMEAKYSNAVINYNEHTFDTDRIESSIEAYTKMVNFSRLQEDEETEVEMSKSNLKKTWNGFNLNKSLKNLILLVGESLDILRYEPKTKEDPNFLRVKECIGKICTITHSKQYVKFCRTVTGIHKKSRNETLEEFYECFGTGEFNLLEAARQVQIFSAIYKNKWIISLLNKYSFEENFY